ncbi:hypothetical protein ACFY1P_04485 [Streptomyces sp. NPDC001407]|uniref:hypothetical protein n=1 Tax=Streptomyces sp. NPDC001407 TaxID=3364573 RepID=UPI0036C4256E
MTTVDLDRWGARIAVLVAPHETELAGAVVRAYAAGGRRRQDLFRGTGDAPGGMGGSLMTVLPDVLDALAWASRAVNAALGSQQVGNAVSTAALLVAVRSRREGGTGTGLARGEAPTPQDVEAAYRMSERLRERGMEPADAERLACELFSGLSEHSDPGEVAAFLDRLLTAEPPQPMPRGPRARRWLRWLLGRGGRG